MGLSLQINTAELCADSQNIILKCVNAKFIKILSVPGWTCMNGCMRHLKILSVMVLTKINVSSGFESVLLDK